MIFLHFLLLLGSVHHSTADPISVLNIRAVFLQHVRVTTPSTTVSATVPSTTLIPVTSAQTTEIETDSDDYKDVDYLSQLSVTKPLTVAGREEESSSTATIVVVSSSSYVAEESVSTDTTTVSSTSSQSEERWEEPASTDSATEHTTSGPLEGSAMPQVTDTTTVVSTLGKTEDGWEGSAVTDSRVASSLSYAEQESVSTDTTVVSTSSRSEDGWEGSATTNIATEHTTSALLEGSAIPKLTTIEPANLSAIGIDRIPHKIRHDHSDSVENVSDQDRQDGSPKVVNHTFMETHGLEDDEDYSDEKLQEGSADQVYFSSSMTPLFTETEVHSSQIVEIEHSGLDSTTVAVETTREVTTTSTTTTTTTTTTVMTTPELLLINDTTRVAFENIDPEQFLMHSDALNRSKEEVYELLSNIEHLSMSYGSTSRDFGSSYILPVLKSIKYDNNSVPLLFTDVPVNVLVQLNIIHLANFDSQQMEYTIDLELKMRWFDMRLANKYSKPVRIRELKVLEQIWRPDPYFVNSKYSYFHLVSFPNFRMRVMPNGLVSYTMRVTLLPACQMVFCRFPHDRQQCDLMISSIAFPRQMVNLIWSETP